MNYKEFTIQNFRSFAEEQSLSFAQPIADKLGSGITYIVGANNSGKTTTIEALWMQRGQFLNDSERMENPPEFKLYSGDGSLHRTVKLIRSNASQFIEDPEPGNAAGELFEIISSRRHWESFANGDDTSTNIITHSATAVGGNPRHKQQIATAVFLKTIEKDALKYEAFTKLVQRVVPDFTEWSIGHETQPYVKYTSASGARHRADFLGDGVISIIRILAHLFENRENGLVIDEPELSLHPLAQKKLAKIIAEYAMTRQIVISTHSPYFVNWDYMRSGAVLNRVAKTGDTNSKIYTLGPSTKYSGLVNGANWRQPFLMDEVAKEIFFAEDSVLFLEGQEDVGLLRPEFADSDIHLFGYGVRGCGNFKWALTMAQDLGFKKVAAIVDAGTDETKIVTELQATFPDYKIIQWNKADIRDKSETVLVAKEGYFDEHGTKKSVSELDDFDEKVKSARDYFEMT